MTKFSLFKNKGKLSSINDLEEIDYELEYNDPMYEEYYDNYYDYNNPFYSTERTLNLESNEYKKKRKRRRKKKKHKVKPPENKELDDDINFYGEIEENETAQKVFEDPDKYLTLLSNEKLENPVNIKTKNKWLEIIKYKEMNINNKETNYKFEYHVYNGKIKVNRLSEEEFKWRRFEFRRNRTTILDILNEN